MIKILKITIASRNMKLLKYIILLNIICINCQKFHQDQYPFPPQFQTASSPILSSDSTIYLPPESSTPIPYYNMNIKKLPINYLPPTAIKAPQIYPSPYPPVFSSSQRPNFEDDESNNNNKVNIRRITIPPSQTTKNITISDKDINTQKIDMRESRTIPAMPNYQQRFINNEKLESKKPNQNAPASPHFNTLSQNPASRRMIITSEIQRNDNGLDQVKSASFPNLQYIQPPGSFISSTVEPAIPILRLSNEMDLDGSFSYEALGADQTHYVQHSRMENMGTDKEEQVVEGSYSYVGDNGQTYTVHYIADSNGYRASGDHLPVPPPIPEIIQRAVQYNLAEEAKKPPHLRQNWENEGTDFETDNSENRYAFSPLRNLFTGRTPEAFSLGFSQSPLIAAASSQTPSKTIYEINKDQNKSMTNIASIAPQITFLASQGAHNPSIQTQQSISRIVPAEKSTLPQIMNYEANSKDSEQETNKALWRLQYSSNVNDQNNQNQNKNTISRSFGEGDDIIINFSNMTPEEYTRMIQSQVFNQNIVDHNTFVDTSKEYMNQDKYSEYYKKNKESMKSDNNNYNDKLSEDYESLEINNTFGGSTNNSIISSQTTESPYLPTITQTEDSKFYEETYENKNENQMNLHSNIINSQNFAPPPQTVTQTYTFEEDSNYEPIKLNTIYKDNLKIKINAKDFSENLEDKTNNLWFEYSNNNFNSTNKPMLNTHDNMYNSDLTQKENDFKPVTSAIKYEDYTSTMSTVTEMINEAIKDNFFLKNLFRPKNSESKTNKEDNLQRKEYIETYINTERKPEKHQKLLQPQHKTQSENKFAKKKTLDMNDVLNFVVMKTQFEPEKTKPKSKPTDAIDQEISQRYIPTINFKDEVQTNHKRENIENTRVKEHPRQYYQERSVPKNYKILQRPKHTGYNSDHQMIQDSYHKTKTFPGQNLPPLGRAGPSLKTYLPPTYV